MSDQQPSTQQQIDYAKWIEEIRRQDAVRHHDKLDDFHTYVNEAAMKSAELTLRMLMLINGGAAVSLLTFTGNLPSGQKLALANTLVWFGSGVALAVAGIAASYLTSFFMAATSSSRRRLWNHPYSEPGPATKRSRILNVVFHVLAIVLAIASLTTFVWGMVEVRNALAHLN